MGTNQGHAMVRAMAIIATPTKSQALEFTVIQCALLALDVDCIRSLLPCKHNTSFWMLSLVPFPTQREFEALALRAALTMSMTNGQGQGQGQCMCTWRYRYPANLGTVNNNSNDGGATIMQQ